MTDLKSIFNHAPKNDPEKSNHLFDWKRVIHSKDDVRELNRLLKTSLKKKTVTLRPKNISSWSGKVKSNGNPDSRKQRVMFKMTYGNSLSMHKRYIKLYMPQIGKDGVIENPELFGCDFEEYEKHMSPLHFKCIISPESQKIDLKVLANSFIKKVEKLTGYELYWMGCIHSDTEHKHVHVAINGIDKNGKSVRFPKDFIKNTMREMLSQTATDMIGERTYEEIQAAKLKLTQAKRWTSYDEEIKSRNDRIWINRENQSIVNRLQFLESIKLAKHDGDFYSVDRNFEEVLKATGRYNTYLEEYLKPDPMPLHIFEGGSITGKIERVISFDKNESWNDAIIVRTKDKRVYIPVYQLHKDNLEGKTIRIEDAKGGLNRNVTDRAIRILKDDMGVER